MAEVNYSTSPPPRSPTLHAKIIVRHLDFYYGETWALKDISMPLYANQVTALIGPSGCGKSTFLRVFNRIYELYPGHRAEGEVLLDGKNILARDVDLNLLRARVGMVYQIPTPFPMSIYDNVAFGIGLYERLSRAEMDDRIESALRRAALWNEVKDDLSADGLGLSGGQQQRLCIARTVALQPDVILLDEPCSALDPMTTSKIEETIHELKVDHTIAIITHNMEQAARISDYAGFMYLGALLEFDSSHNIFTSPQNVQTQRYITGRFG